LRDEEYPNAFAFPVDYPSAQTPLTLAPKAEIEAPFYDLQASDLALVRDGKKHFYMWGAAEYHDVFPETPQRLTKFCVKAGAVTADPEQEWNAETNPVDIRWGHINGHNFMDDDA
jgi:hypothetical protein